jgi:hypothetical protein
MDHCWMRNVTLRIFDLNDLSCGGWDAHLSDEW